MLFGMRLMVQGSHSNPEASNTNEGLLASQGIKSALLLMAVATLQTPVFRHNSIGVKFCRLRGQLDAKDYLLPLFDDDYIVCWV